VAAKLENVGKEYKAYVAIYKDLAERYSKFIDDHRRPDVWLARLETMTLEAQAMKKTLNVASWPEKVVEEMDKSVEAIIKTLESAMDSAHKNVVLFDKRFAEQSTNAKERADALIRKKGTKNKKTEDEEKDDEGAGRCSEEIKETKEEG
jgi:hypothetical protein